MTPERDVKLTYPRAATSLATTALTSLRGERRPLSSAVSMSAERVAKMFARDR
jgi:hypothetical protein